MNSASLDEDLRRIAEPFLVGVPNPLRESILYSFLGPGKRMRPRLVLAVSSAIRLDREIALRLGAAIEMAHAYTLIHDDLPAMDNDDFRRGRPTNHKVYGEATAILAGDSLALLGGDTVLSLPNVEAPRKLAALRILFEAAGTRGVIAGQAMESTLAKPDLAEPEKSLAPLERLLEVFRLKTGALFKAALTLPLACDSTLTEGDRAAVGKKLSKLGEAIGCAFQIADDLEDDFQAEKANPAHIAHYLDAPAAATIARSTLDEAFASLAKTDPASLEFRLREELHPFLEELERKLGKA